MPSLRPGALLLGLACLAPPASARPPTIAVDDIRPGMTGYGLTVFEGVKPDRFPVSVVGVLRNFLPRQDVILIRSDDPRLLRSGVVAGMSGSPIFIDGKLAGALAYGWHFAKEPIAGVTPIANMIAVEERPRRGKESTPSAMARLEEQTLPRPTVAPDLPSLAPASLPLAVAGLLPSALDELRASLAPYGLLPVAGGGAGKAAAGPDRFEAGGAIAVILARGDVSMAGTGTVTMVDGQRVLGFGHPMFNLGEAYLPVSTATIHGFMPSLSSSFKLSTPLREAGSLVQDRQAGLLADTGLRSDMIPLKVTVAAAGQPERTLRAEIARHRFLTPLLASSVINSAAQEGASDAADATMTLRFEIALRGFPPLVFTDHLFATDGVSQKVFGATAGLRSISDLLFNPYERVRIERLDVRVDVAYRAEVAELTGAWLRADELEPGSRPSLILATRRHGEKETTHSLPIDVPASLAGQTVKIEIAAGNLVKPDLAPPESLAGLVANLRRSFSSRTLVVSLQSPDEGLLLRGQVIAGLPLSVHDTLRPAGSSRRGDGYKIHWRTVLPMPTVMTGKRELTVKVKEAHSR